MKEKVAHLPPSDMFWALTEEVYAKQYSALKATWVTWESTDPLWLDLARVAERMAPASDTEPEDRRAFGVSNFIKNLPQPIQAMIIMHWLDDPNPVRDRIARSLKTMLTEAMAAKVTRRGRRTGEDISPKFWGMEGKHQGEVRRRFTP